MRPVIHDGQLVWLLECPGCKTWGGLDDDQLNGRISVDHAADGCEGHYHETHHFLAALPAEDQEAWALQQGYHYADPDARHAEPAPKENP